MKRYLIPIFALSLGVAAQAGDPYDAVVDCNGLGDYLTVAEAINAAPAGRTTPWLILVKQGDYNELVRIPDTKPYIHLIGEGRDKTTIHHPLNYGGQPENLPRYNKTLYWPYSINNPNSSLFHRQSAVLDVNAPHFLSSGIAYVNDWGTKASSGPQALALYSNADCAAFGDCSFRSFQDTWRTVAADSARNYASRCHIEGAVDYIYGGGDVFIENSTLYNVRGGSVIVAPNHGDTPYGYVIKDCIIDGTPESADGRTKLGRPWQRSPKTVYINTITLIPLAEAGWDDMGAVPALFAEYNTMYRDGSKVDLSKRKSHYKARKDKNGVEREGKSRTVLSAKEVKKYNYDDVVKGADGWDPRLMLAPIAAPKGLKLEGTTLSWSPVEGAIGYIVYDGDKIILTTTDPWAPVPAQVSCSYKVRAVNAAGVPGLLAT